MLIGSGVSGRQDPQKCHFLYLSERPLKQSCTTVQTVITSLLICIYMMHDMADGISMMQSYNATATSTKRTGMG